MGVTLEFVSIGIGGLLLPDLSRSNSLLRNQTEFLRVLIVMD